MKAWHLTTRLWSSLRADFTAWRDTFLARSGLGKDRVWARWVTRWMLASLAIHLMAVVSSQGFFQADEHFQIVEFVSYKLGKTEAAQLPIEFQERTAPWLQSAFYMGIVESAQALGVDNPFQWALGFRLASALLGWLATLGLCFSLFTWMDSKGWRQVAVLCFTFLWYLPAFHARHSSENTAGALFFLAISIFTLSLAVKKGRGQAASPLGVKAGALVGLLLGLALETRFQIGWMIVGWSAWAVMIQHLPPRAWRGIAGGFAAALVAGVIADRWGYGEWTFPLANAIGAGLRIGGFWGEWRPVALALPLADSVLRAWPVLGLLTYASFWAGPLLLLRTPIAWATLPLMAWLHASPHKALHDFFPLLHVAPLFVTRAAHAIFERGYDVSYWWKHPKRRWVAAGLLGLNAVALLCTTLMPAWMPAQFYTRLYGLRGYAMNIHYRGDENPFQVFGLTLNFYRPDHVLVTPMQEYMEFVQKLEDTRTPGWLFTKRPDLSPKNAGPLPEWCTAQIQMLPSAIEAVRSRIAPQSQNWTLYKCQAPERAIASRMDDRSPARRPASGAPGAMVAAPVPAAGTNATSTPPTAWEEDDTGASGNEAVGGAAAVSAPVPVDPEFSN